jgi:peroxiredoxin
MAEILEGTRAPNFTLTDTLGRSVSLSDYLGHKHLVLILNRGFM